MTEARGSLLDRCADLVRRAVAAGADEAEVAASAAHSSSVDLETDDIRTATSQSEVVFGVRVFRKGALGFATTNDPDLLDRTLSEALALARLTTPDPLNTLPDPRPLRVVPGLHDPAVAAAGIDTLANVASAVLLRVRELDPRVRVDSGSLSFTDAVSAVASSHGVAAEESETLAGVSLFGMAVDGSDVGSFFVEGENLRSLAPYRDRALEAAGRFVSRCLEALGAGRSESFRGPVIFAPEAVEEFLLENLVAALSASVIRRGQSPLADRLGTAIAAPGFTLVDDACEPGGSASSTFDREGQPHAPLALVEGGVLRSFLYNHYEAAAARARGAGPAMSTGHASGGAGSIPGVGPTALRIDAGPVPLETMIAESPRAVLVHRFSGNVSVDSGEFSGVVKGGFLLTPTGRRPVTETLIAGNLYDLLPRLGAISAERRLIQGSALLPWIRFEDVSVTAG